MRFYRAKSMGWWCTLKISVQPNKSALFWKRSLAGREMRFHAVKQVSRRPLAEQIFFFLPHTVKKTKLDHTSTCWVSTVAIPASGDAGRRPARVALSAASRWCSHPLALAHDYHATVAFSTLRIFSDEYTFFVLLGGNDFYDGPRVMTQVWQSFFVTNIDDVQCFILATIDGYGKF